MKNLTILLSLLVLVGAGCGGSDSRKATYELVNEVSITTSTEKLPIVWGEAIFCTPDGWMQEGKIATYYINGFEKYSLPVCNKQITTQCVLEKDLSHKCD